MPEEEVVHVVAVPKPIAPKRIPKRTAKYVNIFGNRYYLKQLRAPRFKKPFTLMGLLDWDVTIDHLEGLRDNQRKAVDAFIKAAHATAGMALSDRMEILRTVLSGKGRWGGTVRKRYKKASKEEIARKIKEISKLIA